MKNWILPLLLLCAATLKADTTAINATLRTPTGDLFQGSVQISAPDMDCVIGGVTTKFVRWSKTFTVGSTGVLNVSLQANDACTVPDNQQNWYKLMYTPSTGSFTRGTNWVEYWQVPTSASTITEIPRSTATATSPAGIISLIQLKGDGATNGQFLRYNSALRKWEPATVTPGAATWATTADKPTEFPQRCATAGTATAFTCAPSPALTALTAGQTLTLSVHVNSADGPVSLNVSGLGARTLKKIKNGQLADIESGDITTASITTVRYDGTVWIATPYDWNAEMSDSLLAYYSNQLILGNTVTIECRGDSTMQGTDGATGTTATTTAPMAFQSALRAYYQNNAAVVVNNGIGGTNTAGARPLWDGYMSSSTADIIYMNYGINDASMTDASVTPFPTFLNNLRYMVRTARRYGKVVVLETPNPSYSSTGGVNNGPTERARTYAEGVRLIAREMNCPLVDQWANYMDVIRMVGQNTALPDNVHPTATYYPILGRNMAKPLIGGALASVGEQEYTLGSQSLVFGTNKASVVVYPGTRFGTTARGSQITMPVWSSGGKDLYWGYTISWPSAMSSATEVFLDGVSLGTYSQKDAQTTFTSPTDVETLLAKNIMPGLHILEFKATVAGEVAYSSYLRQRTPVKTMYGYNQTTFTEPSYVSVNPVSYWSPSAGATAAFLTDVPTSPNTSMTINLDLSMVKGSGVFVLGARRNGGANPARPWGGYFIYLDVSTGALTRSEAGDGETFQNTVTLASGDKTGRHSLSITVTSAGAVSTSFDGSAFDSYTLVHPWRGGFLGLYTRSTTPTTVYSATVTQ